MVPGSPHNISDSIFLPACSFLASCSQLHEHFYAVPAPIRDYIQEVKAQLAMLTDWPDGGVDIEEKLAFFRETRHTFGRTALLLSGGGGLGSFHLVSRSPAAATTGAQGQPLQHSALVQGAGLAVVVRTVSLLLTAVRISCSRRVL